MSINLPLGFCCILRGMLAWILCLFIFPAFTKGGYVSLKIGPMKDTAYGMALQKDGKILVTGTSHNGVDSDISILRLLPTGELDTTFGKNGFVLYDSRLGDDKGYAIQTLDDDSILVAGCTFNGNDLDMVLMKFRKDGERDLSFGADGFATYDFGPGNDCIYSMQVEEDQKIIVSGTASNRNNNQDFALARFLPDGKPDLSFGNLGGTTQDYGDANETGGNEYAYSVLKDLEHKYWITGYSELGQTSVFSLLRFNKKGKLDTTLRDQGAIIPSFGGYFDKAYASTFYDRYKIIMAGSVAKEGQQQFGLVRYYVTGELDKNFGKNGFISHPIGAGFATIYGLFTIGKKILAVGQSHNGKTLQISLARYLENGALDPSFGNQGVANLAVPGQDLTAYAATVQPDGKIVTAGFIGNAAAYNVSVARFNENGTPDQTFGADKELSYIHDRKGRKSIAAEVGLPAFRFLPKVFLGEE